MGKFEQAVEFGEGAVALEPDSQELIGNLALAYLLAGRVDAAQKSINAAMKLESNDPINRFLCNVIDDVATGKRPLPRSTAELPAKTKPKRAWQFWRI